MIQATGDSGLNQMVTTEMAAIDGFFTYLKGFTQMWAVKIQKGVKNDSKDFDLNKWKGMESGGPDTMGKQTGVMPKANL